MSCREFLTFLFGGKAQVIVGSVASAIGIAAWAYIWIGYRQELYADPLVAAIFHVSMFFGLVACYAIIATGLGLRATERVEQHVMPDEEVS